MLTVLLDAADDAGALGASLATLVSGAVEGLVREVVVIDRGLDAGTRKVADHAGCRVVAAGALAETVAQARGEWLLLLEPGARLSADWIEAVPEHVSAVETRLRTPRAARFSRSARDRPGVFARLAGRRTALAEGLLLPRDQALGLARSAGSLEAMAKGVASVRLDAALRPRPRDGGKG